MREEKINKRGMESAVSLRQDFVVITAEDFEDMEDLPGDEKELATEQIVDQATES